ncbi:hypothetical protein C8Q79DRAFT_268995 [Trametes meyenii]|nr:hypothetical protein C8Q79DRAFT_268995 [Trametes meyenii]
MTSSPDTSDGTSAPSNQITPFLKSKGAIAFFAVALLLVTLLILGAIQRFVSHRRRRALLWLRGGPGFVPDPAWPTSPRWNGLPAEDDVGPIPKLYDVYAASEASGEVWRDVSMVRPRALCRRSSTEHDEHLTCVMSRIATFCGGVAGERTYRECATGWRERRADASRTYRQPPLSLSLCYAWTHVTTTISWTPHPNTSTNTTLNLLPSTVPRSLTTSPSISASRGGRDSHARTITPARAVLCTRRSRSGSMWCQRERIFMTGIYDARERGRRAPRLDTATLQLWRPSGELEQNLMYSIMCNIRPRAS